MSETPQAQRITTEAEPFAKNLISPGYRIGNLIITAGQVATGADGQVVGIGDFDAQTEQVFKNLEGILTAAGSGLNDVVKTNIYVTDIENLPKVVEWRKRVFTPPYPASTLVGVKELVWPELMIEIEVIAVAGGIAQ